MAITNFIPIIWSENLLTALDKKYIAVSHCNRDYEGEITNKGSVVRICGVGEIAINDYAKNNDIPEPQELSDTVKFLNIDRAKYFNFQIDDVERAQSSPKLMEAAMKIAAEGLANEADKYIYSLYSDSELSHFADLTDGDNILDAIIVARQKLYENNVMGSEEVVLEVSPAVASAILKEKILSLSNNGEALENGYLGSVAGCKVFVSNNIFADDGDGNIKTSYCMMRTTRAIAFAEQLSEINAYRPEKRFSDAVKGLHLYGASVVYPNELLTLQVLTEII